MSDRIPRQTTPSWMPSTAALEGEIRRTRRERYRRHRWRVFLVILVIAIASGIALNAYVFDVVTLKDTSMSPTIESGSVVVCFRQSFLDRMVGLLPENIWRIHRGDLVLVSYGEDARPMISRVAAVGGDEVSLKSGAAMVQGEPVAFLGDTTDRVYPIVVPEKELFLLGDHAGTSLDSRRRSFGTVGEADVTGRPLAVLWPVYAIGPVR